jgi:hypothetical protein
MNVMVKHNLAGVFSFKGNYLEFLGAEQNRNQKQYQQRQ